LLRCEISTRLTAAVGHIRSFRRYRFITAAEVFEIASNPMAIGASFIIGLDELGPAFTTTTESNSNDNGLHPPERFSSPACEPAFALLPVTVIAKELARALDWLDVVNAAAIPLRAEPAATRCGEMVE